jgi:hypothetical protein
MQSGNTLEQLPVGEDADRAVLVKAQKALGSIILGKDDQIALALACLLARGHLLIEDLPGLGKTMLAQALAEFWVSASVASSLRVTCSRPISSEYPSFARTRASSNFNLARSSRN